MNTNNAQEANFGYRKFEYQLANHWHMHNVPKELQTPRAEFMRIVSMTEVGAIRTRMFLELMLKDIERAGLKERYNQEIPAMARKALELWERFKKTEKSFPIYQAQVIKAAQSLSTTDDVQTLEAVVKGEFEDSANALGHSKKQSLHWLQGQVITDSKQTYTREEILALIDKAIAL